MTNHIAKKTGSSFLKTNLILILLVVVISVAPLFIANGAEFSGADGLAEEAITEINTSYVPWFSPLFEPASGEIESLLFALQAALGAGVIGYGLGYFKGRNVKSNQDK